MVPQRLAAKADILAIEAILDSAFWSDFDRLEPGAWDNLAYRNDVRARHKREVRDFWPEVTIAEINGAPGGWGVRFAGKNEIAELWYARISRGAAPASL
jgi:hypothetical protein